MRARLPLRILLSTHRFPNERTPIMATPLSSTSWFWSGSGWDWVHTSPRTLLHTIAPLLLDTLLSHNIPFPRVH